MQESVSNNKRIAKNTLMLYIRMLLSIAVTLYTSRVILEVLGVSDYGIYNVVGGVVAMFSFVNSSMAGATSRFLTFELGQGNQQRLRDTFSSSLLIHIGIALLVFVLAETVGLWFLYNKLIIPPDRMTAALWVYQCSVISAMLGFTQVPYNALIIAHERMGVYAYIEIFNVTLKLLIIYLLTIGDFDKLIIYAVLVLFVSVIVMATYRIYCMHNFIESHFHFIWRKDILRPIVSFTGWDFYGNMCYTLRQQGSNFLINNFFGVVANASSGIATTVNGAISGLASNIITAFRPGIIKSYSQKNWVQMQSMINNAIQFSSLFIITLSIPILIDTSYIIQLWLGETPKYVEPFIRLILLTNCIGLVNSVIVIGIHASGRIVSLSFFTGTLYLLSLPVAYFFLKFGFDADIVYLVCLLFNLFILIADLFIIKKHVKEISIMQIIRIIVKSLIVAIICMTALLMLFSGLDVGFPRLLLLSVSDVMIMAILTYIFVLNSTQRVYVKRIIDQYFSRLKR